MPNDLYDDMRKLNALYEELMWVTMMSYNLSLKTDASLF